MIWVIDLGQHQRYIEDSIKNGVRRANLPSGKVALPEGR